MFTELSAEQLIDISQPVTSRNGHFPGDTPFQRQTVLTVADTQVLNLNAFTMSPHIGTHADAPLHIAGNPHSDWGKDGIGSLPLTPFIGPATVVDVSPWEEPLTLDRIQDHLPDSGEIPKRLLIKTLSRQNPEAFSPPYASLSPELCKTLVSWGCVLVGVDGHSIDPVDSKTLTAHHILQQGGLCWLENLDLSRVSTGNYFLFAPPVKLLEMEAAPVRAVLLQTQMKRGVLG